MKKEEKKIETGRLKESDWLVIVALWERGEVTLQELSDKFGTSKPALSQGLKKRGAVRGSKAYLGAKKITEKIEDEREKLIEEIYFFKKRYIKNGELLMKYTMELLDSHKAAGTLGTIGKLELTAIGEATKVFKSVRNDLYFLYDLYDKDSSNEDNFNFNIGVYTESDVESLRNAQSSLEAYDLAEDEEEEVVEEDDRVWEGMEEGDENES